MRLPPKQATVYLRDEGTGVAFRWVCADSDLWREILTDWKRATPHWTGRRYLPITREWFIPYHAREYLYRWLDAWFSDAAQQWEEARGQRQESPRTAPTSPLTQAYATLHLLPTAPPEVVQAAHRALVKLHHPDAGGEHDAAVAINQAITIIREYAPPASARQRSA